MAVPHSVGVSSIQSQTPLLCRVHKGGVLFFRLPRFRPVQGFFAHFSNLFARRSAST